MSWSGILSQAFGKHGGELNRLCDRGTLAGLQFFTPQSSSRSLTRLACDILIILLGWSRIIWWPRYLEFTTAPRHMKSILLDISAVNQLYRGSELDTARPLST
jgi:hypothetical protein